MVAAIGVTVLGWLTSDRVYQRNQMAGYLIGLGTTAIPALAGWGLLRTLKARGFAPPDAVLMVAVILFLGLGVAFFVGLFLFSLL